MGGQITSFPATIHCRPHVDFAPPHPRDCSIFERPRAATSALQVLSRSTQAGNHQFLVTISHTSQQSNLTRSSCCTDPLTTMSHIPAQDESFIGKTMGSGLALSLLSIILAQSLNLYLDLGFRPEACLTVGLVVTIWVFPTTLWLLYHRISLPTWLTFGHPVSFWRREAQCLQLYLCAWTDDRPTLRLGVLSIRAANSTGEGDRRTRTLEVSLPARSENHSLLYLLGYDSRGGGGSRA